MRRLIALAAFATLLSAAACGDGPTEASGSVVGTWHLQTVNGSPPPFTLLEFDGYRLEVLGGVLVMNSNSTYANSYTYRETENGTVTTTQETDIGTWIQSGSTILLEDEEGFQAQATFSGSQLTFIESGFTVRYSR
ncbi:MAG TPA: lipocalin family protein [Gemmatimonadaceae bacterium]|nr:lipocalin family protein [Gemmatimonadaceae bacterium]